MSVSNRDEALRARDLAEGLMKKLDFTGAHKFAVKAQKMDPNLENISRMVMVCDVHIAANANLFEDEMDWYRILQVETSANDITIKKQYRKLALLLHPDKNKLPGAESAFKFIGEAYRILLDKNSRLQHDIKREIWRKPAPPPSYKTQPVRNRSTQQGSFNMSNAFNDLQNEYSQQQPKAQAEPAGFSHSPTFWTTCPFCHLELNCFREYINRAMDCGNCTKRFVAFENPFSFPKQTAFSFPRQKKVPAQKACNEQHKFTNEAANVSFRTVPVSVSTVENNNKKRKRKNNVELSESSGNNRSHKSKSALKDDSMSAQDLGLNGEQQSQRSVRSKQQVSYIEILSDDDVEIATDNGKGSNKNIDAKRQEESKDEKQIHEDEHFTETLPNSINPKEKMKEDEVESSAGAGGDAEEGLSSRSETEPKDIATDYGEGSIKNIDTKRQEESKDKKQTHEDHHSTETLPNGINPKKKMKEDEVGSSAGAGTDAQEDLNSGSETEPDVVTCGDTDFNNFDDLRAEHLFKAGQIWALYDDEEAMPRFYALIKKVTTSAFSVKYVWLEEEKDEENKPLNLSASFGKYILGDEQDTNVCNVFSHLMVDSKKRTTARHFTIFPKKGEIWALFKNWNNNLSFDLDSPRKYEYVEILSDHLEGASISVGFLSKVKGFKFVFCPMQKDGSNSCEIPPHQFCRFSHCIPSYRLKGTEGKGVSEGWYELDPNALLISNTKNQSGEEIAQDQDHQLPPS